MMITSPAPVTVARRAWHRGVVALLGLCTAAGVADVVLLATVDRVAPAVHGPAVVATVPAPAAAAGWTPQVTRDSHGRPVLGVVCYTSGCWAVDPATGALGEKVSD